MEDFFVQYKSEITRFVELLATITGLIFYKKYKFTSARYFVFFLVYLSLGDFINTYVYYIKNDGIFSFLEGTVFQRNTWWSTLFWKIGAILFFGFYYSKILKNKKFKRVVKVSSYFFFFYSLMCIVFNFDDFFIKSFSSISIFGAIIIIFCSVFYFIEILQSEKILTFYRDLNFYISTSIFIWWVIITPLVFYDTYNLLWDWNFIFLRWQIYLFANIVMYSTFTFALIFCSPENDNI